MASFRAFTLVLSLLALQTRRTLAQSASCNSGWAWMNNSLGLDPCQMVASLDGSCLGAQLVIPKLANGTVYAPPTDTNSPSAICDCNSPIYSLYSACAACQGAGWFGWKQWSAVCGIAHVGVFPDGYFVTTRIPNWAFINVTVDGTFVPNTAMLVGDLPELPASGPKTASLPASSSTLLPMKSPSSSLPSSSSLSSSSNLPSVTPTDTPKPKNPTPAGAIAGGTIGGIVFLSLIGFALYFFRKPMNLKSMGLKIPRIRRASGPISLFESEERRTDLQAEEEVAVKHPLLYDPTNPATFSQINAELERHLQLPGIGNQGDATPVTLQHYNR